MRVSNGGVSNAAESTRGDQGGGRIGLRRVITKLPSSILPFFPQNIFLKFKNFPKIFIPNSNVLKQLLGINFSHKNFNALQVFFGIINDKNLQNKKMKNLKF